MRIGQNRAMVRYRVTGVSAWGIQWERKDDDRELARRLFLFLEDRRMLWKDFSLEIEEHCVHSADHARHQLTALLSSPEISPRLAPHVSAIRAAFREFMDEVGDDYEHDYRRHRYSGDQTDTLSLALGRLRALLGVKIGEIASTWNVDVPDNLATIVPDQAGWFFEKLSADEPTGQPGEAR